ncbi:MAG TPA: ABC-type transport auxiliary lipoprotein family protein [bacterium]
MKISQIVRVVLCLVPVFFACCSTIPEMHYYLIDYPIFPKNNNGEPILNVSLGIERFQATALFSDERLVYRDTPYEGKYYHYHRWITSPEDMMTDKAIEQLNASNLFSEVVPFPKFSNVDYVLSGTIKALEEWDEGDQWFARVQIAFELFDRNTRQGVWNKTIEKRNPVLKRSPAEVIKGINLSVQQCIDELSIQLKSLLSSR